MKKYTKTRLNAMQILHDTEDNLQKERHRESKQLGLASIVDKEIMTPKELVQCYDKLIEKQNDLKLEFENLWKVAKNSNCDHSRYFKWSEKSGLLVHAVEVDAAAYRKCLICHKEFQLRPKSYDNDKES
jgi:hypothetical protein